MRVLIGNTEYEYLDHIVENEAVRNNFIELINNTFGFNFTKWYEEGFWSEKYEPHVLVKDNQVVATVTVNHMKYWYQEEKTYIQLGGVLTRKEYRKRGLNRWLIEHIIERYQNQCDQIFLLSNDSAVEFYPKFGFKKAVEYIAQYEWKTEEYLLHREHDLKIRKLNINTNKDRELLLECYQYSNPFSKFPSIECEELLIFYGMGLKKDCFYYFPELGLAAIANFRKNVLMVEDIYGKFKEGSKEEVIKYILHGILAYNGQQKEQRVIQFGFSPFDGLSGITVRELVEKDDTLYILEKKENLFAGNKLRFPILSHN